MKKLIACLVVLASALLVGQEPPKPEQAALSARVAFLEVQLEAVQNAYKVCDGNLIAATAAKRSTDFQAKLAQAAKGLQCQIPGAAGVDWNANPPACLPEKPSPRKPSEQP